MYDIYNINVKLNNKQIYNIVVDIVMFPDWKKKNIYTIITTITVYISVFYKS